MNDDDYNDVDDYENEVLEAETTKLESSELESSGGGKTSSCGDDSTSHLSYSNDFGGGAASGSLISD